MAHPLRRYSPFLLTALLVVTGSVYAPADDRLDLLEESYDAVRKFTLDNGMVCLVKEDHHAPMVSVQFWVGTGSIHEDEYLGAGLSHYVEHMFFKGTPTRSPTEVTSQIDAAGGRVNAYTTLDRTVFYCVMPADHWKVGFDVLADAAMHAHFPEEEWEREKNVVFREMTMGRDSPGRVISKLLFRTVYRVHPFKYPVIGYDEVLTKVQRETLLAFFKRHYVPDNMILVISGDVSGAEAENTIRETLSSFERRPRPPVVIPHEPKQVAPRFQRKTGAYQVTRLEWAYPSVELSHPDAPALDVLAVIAGSGRSSRLVRRIKEEQQRVYSIHASSFTPEDPGIFSIDATMDPEKEREAIMAIEEELASWHNTSFGKDEIEKAKRMFLVGELSGLETVEGQAVSIASGEFYTGDPGFSVRYLKQIQSVGTKDLERVVTRYLVPERRTLVLLSPEVEEVTEATEAPPRQQVVKPEMVTLSNGIRLILREDHRLPFVHFAAALRGGLLSETETHNGITRLMSQLFTRGTMGRSAEEIAAWVEGRGGSIGGYSGLDGFGLTAKCLTDDTEDFMELLADCLTRPTFPEAELEKECTVQVGSIRQQKEQPMFLAQEQLARALYEGHPYRWSPLGEEDTLTNITRRNLVAHFRRLVTTENLVLSVFGDIDKDEVRRLAEKHLKTIRPGPLFKQSHERAQVEPQDVERREPKEQAIYIVGYPGVDRDDPRVDELDILRTAMSGLSSDLGIEIREKRGLVYYVGAYQRNGLDAGQFAFYAGTVEESLKELRKQMDIQIDRITSEGLREDEVEQARAQIISGYYRQLQSNAGLAQTSALHELYGLGYDHFYSLEERMRKITRENVRDAAASILRKDQQVVSLVLPEAVRKKDSQFEDQENH